MWMCEELHKQYTNIDRFVMGVVLQIQSEGQKKGSNKSNLDTSYFPC